MTVKNLTVGEFNKLPDDLKEFYSEALLQTTYPNLNTKYSDAKQIIKKYPDYFYLPTIAKADENFSGL